MNTHGMKGKRRQLQRALESIQIAEPPQRAKVHTETSETYLQPQNVLLQRPSGKDDKGMRALRRYYRYKQGEEEEATLNKYKSLDMAKRNLRRRSEQRLNHSLQRNHPSLERSPYLPLNQRKLAVANSKEGLTKVASKEGRKLSLPKKGTLRNRDPLDDQTIEQLKQSGQIAMKKGDFSAAFRAFERADGKQSDLQLLDLSGVCLMNMRHFQEAVVRLSRVVLLDRNYSKKVYISLALCQNQLNHSQRCLHYVNQCISLFPDYYEAFYFKGKLLYKQQLYERAIDLLLQAAALHPSKKQIKLLVAECYYLLGQQEQALIYYERYLGEITIKNVKHAVRYGPLLVKLGRESEGIAVLEGTLKSIQGAEGVQSERVEVNSFLSLAYFRRGNYELCAMRGEEVLSRGTPPLVLQVIKSMIACKIIEHDYYGAIYFLRRIDQTHLNHQQLESFVDFLDGIAMLMKRRVEEALVKFQNLPKLLTKTGIDQFSKYINDNFHLFVVYGLFLRGSYEECLKEVASQRQIGVQSYWEDTLGYIQCICQAMISYNNKAFESAQKKLVNCIENYPLRAEASLYLALLQLKLSKGGRDADGQGERAAIFHHLTVCADRFGSSSSNYAAYIYYYRGLLAAWEGEWTVAASELELAIEKSEDNFFNFYYIRALVLANLQNYKQAISDASLALSISQQAPAYLLRARCLQIDGNPGQAFADLQAFIARLALRPEDKQVHKFAGHLLFQNGAFEDALQAYGQGEVGNTDLQVFLTRSKTYFLLGNFLRAAEDMQEAARIHPDAEELIFDQRVIQWLALLLQRYIKNQNEDDFEFQPQALNSCLQQLRTIYKEGSETEAKYGKIFKLPEYLTFSAVCQFYLQEYSAAMDSLIQAIQLKRAALQSGQEDAEGDFQQEQAEKLVFINQMYYNIAVCCCMAQDYPNAQRYLRKCAISPQLHNYDTYLQLLDHITGRQPVQEDAQYLDLFSLRNKLSKYMPKVKVPFLFRATDTLTYRLLKLCIPYPKVEPPEITPPFDINLIKQIDLNDIERRADAPWIFRQKDSIKFTERIDVFSRFQLQKSDVGDKKVQMVNPSGSSFEGIPVNLREQLRLDARLEEKLNKLIRKDK